MYLKKISKKCNVVEELKDRFQCIFEDEKEYKETAGAFGDLDIEH